MNLVKKMVDQRTEWWNALLKGEKEIDIEQISRERDFSNGLPADAAEKLRKKLFAKNQSYKAANADIQTKKVKQQNEKVPQNKQQKVVDVTEMTQDDFQKDPDTFNGAARKHYKWSQDFGNVEAKFHLPSHIKKNKQVRVQYDEKHLLIEVEDVDPCKPMIKFIDSDFKHNINPHLPSTTWWLEDGDKHGKDLGVNFLCCILFNI